MDSSSSTWNQLLLTLLSREAKNQEITHILIFFSLTHQVLLSPLQFLLIFCWIRGIINFLAIFLRPLQSSVSYWCLLSQLCHSNIFTVLSQCLRTMPKFPRFIPIPLRSLFSLGPLPTLGSTQTKLCSVPTGSCWVEPLGFVVLFALCGRVTLTSI